MDWDAVTALSDHWRRYPPAHIAIRRLERTVCALVGAELREPAPPASRPSSGPSRPERLPTAEECFAFADALNALPRGVACG